MCTNLNSIDDGWSHPTGAFFSKILLHNQQNKFSRPKLSAGAAVYFLKRLREKTFSAFLLSKGKDSLMHVVHIGAEMVPFAKVGGLGDVIHSLPKALAKEGVDVSVIIPKYKSIPTQYKKDFAVYKKNVPCYDKGFIQENTFWHTTHDNIKIYLLEPSSSQNYFSREKIYGYRDDANRFIYFSRAALELLLLEKTPIDVLHIHDWHTALIPILYEDIFQKKGLVIKKIVLTIHNLEHQGLCSPIDLDKIGLHGIKYLTPVKLQDNNPRKKQTLNLLKGGIIYSSFITTVSPSYADEILYKEKGSNLDSTLRAHEKKLFGILNGIDTHYWDPKTDLQLIEHYSQTEDIKTIIEAKKKNKEKLRKQLGLDNKQCPLIANIGRLVPQKGPKLIEHALLKTLEKKSQFVLLGSIPVKKIANMFFNLEKTLKNNNNAYMSFEYHEELSHLIFAACDFILVPSLFEPCGLTQILAMRYGSIPIVRKTGGLKDTVFDIDFSHLPEEKRNGYTFEKFSFKALDSALIRAIDCWFSHPEKYASLVHTTLKIDHSWAQSVKKYLILYEKEPT